MSVRKRGLHLSELKEEREEIFVLLEEARASRHCSQEKELELERKLAELNHRISSIEVLFSRPGDDEEPWPTLQTREKGGK